MAEVTSQKEGSQKGTPVLTEAQQEKAEELAQLQSRLDYIRAALARIKAFINNIK